MSKTWTSDGRGRNAVPLAVEPSHSFPEFGGYLRPVGYSLLSGFLFSRLSGYRPGMLETAQNLPDNVAELPAMLVVRDQETAVW
jgi:hypothetical protein